VEDYKALQKYEKEKFEEMIQQVSNQLGTQVSLTVNCFLNYHRCGDYMFMYLKMCFDF